MKNRFIPENANHPPQLVSDPDSYDASEEHFAASLEPESASPVPQPFLVLTEDSVEDQPLEYAEDAPTASGLAEPSGNAINATPPADTSTPVLPDPTLLQVSLLQSDDAWRHEVSAKLSRYRARKRTRSPRYPSLQLKFESPAPTHPPSEDPPVASSIAPSRLAIAIDETAVYSNSLDAQESALQSTELDSPPSSDSTAKIIEFPRFFTAPPPLSDELAAPVGTGPRILEVPEQMPPPPALGGILIEPDLDRTAERRPGFELPLSPPRMSRRVAAGLIDFAIIVISFAAFALMFYRMTHAIPAFKQSVGVGAALIAAMWMIYQYLFLVYSAATPGLRLSNLQLARFDGTLAPRRLRRWRVLASILSGLSLALGYIWCFFDEDQLCWHDRITHTYMALPSGSLLPDPSLQ
jgi:uncharacterized RDD family membrane protein YckC